MYTVVNGNPTGVQFPVSVQLVAAEGDSIPEIVLAPGEKVTVQNLKNQWVVVA